MQRKRQKLSKQFPKKRGKPYVLPPEFDLPAILAFARAYLLSFSLPQAGSQPGGEEEEGKGRKKGMNTEPTLRPSVVVSLTAVIAPSLPTCRTISVLLPAGCRVGFWWVGGSVGGMKWISEKEKKSRFPISPFPFSTSVHVGERRALIPTEVDNNKGYLYKHSTAAEMRASRGIVRENRRSDLFA